MAYGNNWERIADTWTADASAAMAEKSGPKVDRAMMEVSLAVEGSAAAFATMEAAAEAMNEEADGGAGLDTPAYLEAHRQWAITAAAHAEAAADVLEAQIGLGQQLEIPIPSEFTDAQDNLRRAAAELESGCF